MRNILQCCFAAACLCGMMLAQAPGKTLSQLPPNAAEPFKIQPGSSFSASPSRQPKNFSLPENGRLNPEIIAQDFSQALDVIRDNYIGGAEISVGDLTKSSLTSMLHSLDPHSNYYNPTDYQELLSDEQSQYSGVGASIANFTKNGRAETYVTATFDNSPAYRAGLRFGDKIISVNGENMSGKNSFYVRGKIRGVKNSIAKLAVERAATGRVETLEIRRATVPQPSIPDAYIVRPGVGYIDLTNGFNYTTFDEFGARLKSLREQGMSSLILDLRGNPGGIVEQAVKVAEEFLPAGQTILTQRGRVETDNRTWKSFNKKPETAALAVLVDGGSASASEIVTGALQDCDRALVVGEKTFGKGLVQSVLNLPYGAGLTLTTAKYYTPSGRSIQRDYSQGNLYDYFQHRINYDKSKQPSTKTTTGRNVFGGDGILPDEVIAAPRLAQSQIALLDPIFFFTRELANGKVSGLENYKITAPIQYGKRVAATDFPVGDALLNAFKNYLKRENFPLSPAQFEADKRFIAARLRFNLTTAAFGSITANQILIENDLLIAKAADVLPRAQNLAINARRVALRK